MPAQITALPTPPSTNDPANFNTRADAFLGQMPTFATEANALAAEVAVSAAQVADDRMQTGLDRAAASASAASAANGPGTNATSSSSLTIGTGPKSLTLDQAGKAYAVGQRVSLAMTASPLMLMNGVITAFTPSSGAMTVNIDYLAAGASGSASAWTVALSGVPGPTVSGTVGVRAATANSSVSTSDLGKAIRCSGTFTLTMLSASAAGSTGNVLIKNDGSGKITIVRSSSDTLDSLSTYVMYPGEARIFLSNGTDGWTSVVMSAFCATFTVSEAAFIWPPGYRAFQGIGWGGGGSGGDATINISGSGGGGAPGLPFFVEATKITVGAAASLNVGSSGGSSAIPSLGLTFYPGSAGIASTVNNLPATEWDGNQNSNPDRLFSGGKAGSSASTQTSPPMPGTGGSSVYGSGGGGGGGFGAGAGGSGGKSILGGAGGAGGAQGPGLPGVAPGGGGGGGAYNAATATTYPGGVGARGEIRLWGIA